MQASTKHNAAAAAAAVAAAISRKCSSGEWQALVN